MGAYRLTTRDTVMIPTVGPNVGDMRYRKHCASSRYTFTT